MGLEVLIKLNKEIIEARAAELKAEFSQHLDAQAKGLTDQIEALSKLPVPEDMFTAMVDKGASIWVSKVVAIDDTWQSNFRIGNSDLFYDRDAREQTFKLKKGVYKVVVLAIPQDVRPNMGDGRFKDDYGFILDTRNVAGGLK